MLYTKLSRAGLLLGFLLFSASLLCQLPYNITDGRQGNDCKSCERTIAEMPREVLFGIQINSSGDVYFSMNNTQWFDKIFKNDVYGVCVDIVSMNRYECSNNLPEHAAFSLPRGNMMQPVYKPQLIKGKDAMTKGSIFVKVGTIAATIMKDKLEGNLAILNGNRVCFYTNFVNIDRNVWELLPMGLYTDSLIQNIKISAAGDSEFFTYTKKIQLEVPFEKSSARFNSNYMNHFYDSLEIKKYIVRKIEVRAYSSVEGPENVNKDLMARRAQIIIQGLKRYQPSLARINVVTAENWLEFFRDIPHQFADLQALSKPEIKERLTDRTILDQMEPMLARHRKAVITLYLETKSAAAATSDNALMSTFKKAIEERNISRAKTIQKELADRIMDKRLPAEYIDRLEIPHTKEFSSLLNDREVYRYLLKSTAEYEALENFLALKKLDPENGHINYNICALRFFMWQFGGDSSSNKTLLKDINALPTMGIYPSLVKRMLINYHILQCEENMATYNYPGKDSALETIRTIYKQLNLNDEDIYSIAKYFAYYAHQDWAREIILPRIDKIDVSQDLVFYFINLQFFNPLNYKNEYFKKAILNAINLNSRRFCNFFLPNDKGGASMQLLDYKEIKSIYCDVCK